MLKTIRSKPAPWRWAVLGLVLLSLGAHATEGEVRKIDLAQAKVTIKSNALPALDMPAMTLVFKARPASLLNGLSEGDQVEFEAAKIDGQYTVTALRKR